MRLRPYPVPHQGSDPPDEYSPLSVCSRALGSLLVAADPQLWNRIHGGGDEICGVGCACVALWFLMERLWNRLLIRRNLKPENKKL